ncbi:hypothetical protein LCL61_28105 [Amycolatopsis coloradensis]|uniref:Uncharacterized protein n=1 Tax=Amycolatopsis coloradensis TaxID=76021 RepID=A0ACD5BIY7_9PSEU
MRPDRVVQLRWASKTVAIGDVDDQPETLSYSGISLVRRHGDHVVDEVWLPVGEEPTFADDEALITALRTAWSWSSAAA